jgi:outer membrane lipoprotein-sorting protein
MSTTEKLQMPTIPRDRIFVRAGAIVSIALATWISSAAAATDAEIKGLEIAKEIDRRDQGFGDSEVNLEMELTNRNGETSTRRLRFMTLEIPAKDQGDKSLSIFDHPRDVKGTAFLSHTKILEPDDQWLFLPALKRVKRISSANKSGPFVGSEFAYEDLTSFEVGKYKYEWLRDEPCGELTCFVTVRYPLYQDSGYTRQVTWVDTKEYRIQKVEFYDRKEELLKTLTSSEFKQYLGKYWRAHRMHMENHQTGKKTTLVFSDFKFNADLKESDFTKNRLKRVR